MGISFYAGHKNERWLVALDAQYIALQKQLPPIEDTPKSPEDWTKLIDLLKAMQKISLQMTALLGVFGVVEGGKAGDA